MAVVTSAIRTIIENNAGERMPRSYPTLSTINSISPRVFIRMPSARESRHVMPVHRAASNPPPSLPAIATAIIASKIAQK